MNLAKHEVPKMRGVPAIAPGYGRIDGMTGSIQWQVDLGDNQVDLLSRQSIADCIRDLVTEIPDAAEVRKFKKKIKDKERKAAQKRLRRRR